MADFGAIFSVVTRASSLALELYKLRGRDQAADEVVHLAKCINSYSLAVKQLGTVIRDDDTQISSKAVEILGDILTQSIRVLIEIQTTVFNREEYRDGPQTAGKADPKPLLRPQHTTKQLQYLQLHLECLKATTIVMQQVLHTTQAIIWATLRPSISPNQAAAVVANEKTQLQSAIIEQQIHILLAAQAFETVGPDAGLLMESNSADSLAIRGNQGPMFGDLHRYQDRFLSNLNTTGTGPGAWLPTVCSVSKAYMERLLERWTRLPRFFDRLQQEERKMRMQKREDQQPSVESESEYEDGFVHAGRSREADIASPSAHQPGSVQPLFGEGNTLPIPIPEQKYGHTTPQPPATPQAASPRASGASLIAPNTYSPASPISPRISFIIPVEAAAAVEAKDDDNDVDLEIPWKLCTRKCYWKYVDAKVEDSNTHLPPTEAFKDRHSWTELSASWVCKEALKEQGFPYRTVQKDARVGRRTKWETCFCIQQPLRFDQVQRLVERTVEIYRAKQPPSPLLEPESTEQEKEKVVLPVVAPPLLERSISYAYPSAPLHPQPPTSLERTISLPTASRLIIPPTQTYASMPSNPHFGQALFHPSPQQSGPYSSSAPYTNSAPFSAPLPFHPSSAHGLNQHFAFPVTAPKTHLHPTNHTTFSPQQESYHQHRSSHYRSSKDYTDIDKLSLTSDSDTAERRKHTTRNTSRSRSRSRRPSSSSHKRRHSGVGTTLALGGGLAALLDGVLNSGVL